MKALPRSTGKTVAKRGSDKDRTITDRTIAPKLKLWVVFDERVKFGDGRAQLLELIDQLGSIKNAVASTGMSYRAAWGYLKELEQAAGFAFLERKPGSGPGSGTQLTREAKAFLRDYRRFQHSVEERVEIAFHRAFRR